MKKSGGSNNQQSAGGNRGEAGGGGGFSTATGGHRSTASSSVGTSLKARGSNNAAQDSNNERTGYHQGGASGGNQASKPNAFKQTQQSTLSSGAAASSGQERKCDSCKYRTPINQCTTFRCRDCGTYIICEYCYEDYMDKGGYYDGNTSDSAFNKKIQCVYCWSRHTLTDICVKTLKSLGFMPVKGSNKIQISNLTREKIKKLSNLRVIQKTLVYVIGIAPEIASEDKLKSVEYFGQYGNLQKVVVNTKDVYNATRGGPSYSAYLTFQSARESAIAILSVDQCQLNDRMIRASFGTSKFCQFFLNNQKCNNKDCLYLHELRADLEAYTKEDMQNNKFIFLEQQKIAIKLSKALDLSKDQFNKYNLDRNEALRVATDKAKRTQVPLKAVLPAPDSIYHKDFHFLDEPLIERQAKREAALAAKAAAKLAAANSTNEIDSASTAATNATTHSSQSGVPSSAGGVAASSKATVSSKISAKQLKGAAASAETQEESKQSSSLMPIFTNQKDVINQARKQSQLRAPFSKQSGAQTDSSSAKNSHSTSSNQATATNSESRVSESAAANGRGIADGGNASTAAAKKEGNSLFPFEPFAKASSTKEGGAEASGPVQADQQAAQSEDNSNILTKQSKESNTTIFQNLIQSQLASQAAQNEKISVASAAAAERFRKKEIKKKKKIVVETREQVAQSALAVEQANVKKVDTAQLATQVSPVKLSGKEPSAQSQVTVAPMEESKVSQPTSQQQQPSQAPAPQQRTAQHSTRIATSPKGHQEKTSKQEMGKAGASTSQPPNNKFGSGAALHTSSNTVNLNNNRAHQTQTESASSMLVSTKDKQETTKSKKPDFMQTQTVSLSSFKKLGGPDEDNDSEQSPAQTFSRIQSRFNFAHSLDPIKKQANFQFGFGLAQTDSELDKDEILVPMKVQELIHRSIRTLSNSVSNRSPDEVQHLRDASNELIPVQEIEAELEQRWYTMEEKFQEELMMSRDGQQSPHYEESKGEAATTTAATSNPFRMLHKKDKEQVVGGKLDVKRVKYSYKQTSPSGEDKQHNSPEHGEDTLSHPTQSKANKGAAGVNTSPFQTSAAASGNNSSSTTNASARANKGGRRVGPQAERARQPPNNR